MTNHVVAGCLCGRGWRGSSCEEKCPQGTYGLNCSEACHCGNGGQCHHTDGTCTCQPGFTGQLCDQGKLGTIMQGPYGALRVLKSLEFDWTKFKAFEIPEFYKVVLKSLEFNYGQ